MEKRQQNPMAGRSWKIFGGLERFVLNVEMISSSFNVGTADLVFNYSEPTAAKKRYITMGGMLLIIRVVDRTIKIKTNKNHQNKNKQTKKT